MRIEFWAGDQESFEVVLRAQELVAEGIKAGRFGSDMSELPPLWDMRGSTAVVRISGSLIDGSAGWLRMFGVTGYDDIAEAAIAAAMNPDTKSMLYVIESPGGEVSGVVEMNALLGQISALKPSAVYTGKQMASAGYWLASGVKGAISAGPTAEVGSIGVLRVLTDATKAMSESGVVKTIMRAGKHKALINPYETPSAEALAHVQEQLDDIHVMFQAAVGAGRPNLSTEKLLEVTQGRTFIGKRAVQAGLADKVQSFEVALKLLDSQNPTGNTPSNSKGKAMKITDLTDAQRAAISAGASPASMGITLEELTPAEQAAANAVAAEAASAAEVAAEAARQAAAAGTAATPPPAAAAAPSAEVVALLTGQVAAAQAALVPVQAELLNVKAQVTALETAQAGLLAIARNSVGKMSIALGGNASAADSFDAAGIIAEHARISATFNEKFKPGGVTKTVQADATPVEKVDPRFAHFARNSPRAAK